MPPTVSLAQPASVWSSLALTLSLWGSALAAGSALQSWTFLGAAHCAVSLSSGPT